MKQNTLLSVSILCLAVLATHTASGKSAELTRIINDIKRVELRFIGEKTLFSNQLNPDGVKNLNNAVAATRVFVEKQDDKDLSTPMRELENESNSLINTIKLTYSTVFGTIPEVMRGDANSREQSKKEFTKLKERITKTKAKIKRSLFLVPAKQDAKEALTHLAKKLNTLVDTAIKDMNTEIAQRS